MIFNLLQVIDEKMASTVLEFLLVQFLENNNNKELL
jgi:hypothetical protein